MGTSNNSISRSVGSFFRLLQVEKPAYITNIGAFISFAGKKTPQQYTESNY